jgi:hypothetical protein
MVYREKVLKDEKYGVSTYKSSTGVPLTSACSTCQREKV